MYNVNYTYCWAILIFRYELSRKKKWSFIMMAKRGGTQPHWHSPGIGIIRFWYRIYLFRHSGSYTIFLKPIYYIRCLSCRLNKQLSPNYALCIYLLFLIRIFLIFFFFRIKLNAIDFICIWFILSCSSTPETE